MRELAKRLSDARSRRGMTLESASSAAKISPAYLHKLEAGRVQTPSPHVLRRLATVLGESYLALMTLTGYLEPSEVSGRAKDGSHATSVEKGKPMKQAATSGSATNAEIVRLLQAVQAELGELRRGQAELAKKLEKATSQKAKG